MTSASSALAIAGDAIAEEFEEELLVELRPVSGHSRKENFAGHVHEGSPVPRGVVGERLNEFLGHEPRVSSFGKGVLESGDGFRSFERAEVETDSKPATERQEVVASKLLAEALVATENHGEQALRVELVA